MISVCFNMNFMSSLIFSYEQASYRTTKPMIKVFYLINIMNKKQFDLYNLHVLLVKHFFYLNVTYIFTINKKELF